MLTLVAVLTLLQSPVAAPQAPAATPVLTGYTGLEYVYVHLANRLAHAGSRRDRFYSTPETLPVATRICEKINPSAVEVDRISNSYVDLRSNCFNVVAVAGAAPEICDRIRSSGVADAEGTRSAEPSTASCRDSIARGDRGVGWTEIGNEMIALLLGYTPAQIAAAAGGRAAEEGGATEFMSHLVPVIGDDQESYDRAENFLKRIARLPDFSRGDDAARRQLDSVVPGWSSPVNKSRLAEALRCAMPRGMSLPSCML